jgi:hypothetical protein
VPRAGGDEAERRGAASGAATVRRKREGKGEAETNGERGWKVKVFVLTNKRAGYDEFDGFVVQAESEKEARWIAALESQYDGGDKEKWNRESQTTCEEVDPLKPGLVMASFNGG